MGPALGIGILATILVLLYVANQAVEEMLKKEKGEKGDPDANECAGCAN